MQNIVKNCSEWIEYPEKAVLSPILATFYNRTEVELISRRGMSSIRSLSRKPHRYCLRGKLTCQGQLMSINKDHCMTNDEFEDLFVRYPFFPLSDLFCELVSKSNSSIVRWAFAEDLRFTDEMKNCSFSRRTTDRRLYRCENTTEFISLHRVNDGYRDCLYSDDERNSRETRIGPYRYRCQTVSSPFQYVSYQQLGNGIDDCLDRSDEEIYSWNRTRCPRGTFACADGKGCRQNRCDQNSWCEDSSNSFWCSNPSRSLAWKYRSTKDQTVVSKSERSCSNQAIDTAHRFPSIVPDRSLRALISPLILSGYCNRGFYLFAPDRSTLYCFCPPSYYGDRCQYDRRRVTVLLRFDRGDRERIPLMINVLVTLVHNKTRIVDHHFLTNFARENSSKHHLYLLYPRPRPPGSYSVRVEAYHSLRLLAFWEYPLSPFELLPVIRLAKVLEFAQDVSPSECRENYCRNSGRCSRILSEHWICLCPWEWHGTFCEKRTIRPRCAPHSLVREDQICICPQGFFLPNCYVRNRVCEQSQICQLNETCYPSFRRLFYVHSCLSNRLESSATDVTLIIRRNRSSSLSVLAQLFKLSDYPMVGQQILISPSTTFPLRTVLSQTDSSGQTKWFALITIIAVFEPFKRTVDRTLH